MQSFYNSNKVAQLKTHTKKLDIQFVSFDGLCLQGS